MKAVKWISVTIVLIAVVIGIVWINPSTRYLTKTFRYFLPGIDDYPKFENRVVKASDPSPWIKSPFYNMAATPAVIDDTAEELKTIAYLVVKDSTIP